jgi:hypothetical protein
MALVRCRQAISLHRPQLIMRHDNALYRVRTASTPKQVMDFLLNLTREFTEAQEFGINSFSKSPGKMSKKVSR